MLSNGDPMPPIPAKDLEGNAVIVTDLTEGSWSVVLLYRGHW